MGIPDVELGLANRMDTTQLDELVAYWHTLPVAEGAIVPAKSTLSPERLTSLLPHIGIFELVSRYDLQVRLFGTTLDDKFGQAMTGTNLFDIIDEKYRELYADLYATVLETPAGGRTTRDTLDTSGHIIRGEGLILPMADDSGVARYTVGMMLMESDSPLDGPMDVDRVNQANISGLEFIDIGYGLPANPPKLPD